MSKPCMREPLWGLSHSKEDCLLTDKVLCPKNGRHKITDPLRKGTNPSACQQAAFFLDNVKGMLDSHPRMYALLVRLCRAVSIKRQRRVIKLTAVKWKGRPSRKMGHPGPCYSKCHRKRRRVRLTALRYNWKRLKGADRPPGAWIYQTAHSVRANKDWYGGAQPSWPLPREGIG